MFYTATLDSVLTFGMSSCSGNVCKQVEKRKKEKGLDENSKGTGGVVRENARKHRHSLASTSDKQTKPNFG